MPTRVDVELIKYNYYSDKARSVFFLVGVIHSSLHITFLFLLQAQVEMV